MKYLDGKFHSRKQIGAYLNSQKFNGVYFEPFCGGLWITEQVKADVKIISDANKPLIIMYEAIQSGWEPPDIVTEEEYQIISEGRDLIDDPIIAFIGIACSFGGKWFGGYARGNLASGKRHNYAKESKTSLLKQFQSLKDVSFLFGDYMAVYENIRDTLEPGCLIYCDPPYVNTTQYGAIPRLDPHIFWNTMREWSIDHKVFISEYIAPPDFECVLEFPVRLSVRSKEGCAVRTEKLFRWKGQTCLY
jgi:DNA adenine methylase